MFKLHITRTARKAGRNQEWYTYDNETREFFDLEDLIAYLDNIYYHNVTKDKMYQDDDNGNSVHIGYIYQYKDSEYNPKTGEYDTYYYNDWVTIREYEYKDFILV